jgi:hypothetical protein
MTTDSALTRSECPAVYDGPHQTVERPHQRVYFRAARLGRQALTPIGRVGHPAHLT